MRILDGYANDRLVFSPDGQSLLGGNAVWGLATGEARRLPAGRLPWGFTPDGAALFGFASRTGASSRFPTIFRPDGAIVWQSAATRANAWDWNSVIALCPAAGRLAHAKTFS